ncbi:fumarylacetoacetate hydrolase family protein [Rhizobium rhizogenes]|uniref:fumarylacetoacetate hydrolase family protein n=1 Tax=Rhizobium rhizogenes TaxID=359 RepID=UPI00157498C5|nr:fumarylacetoacetate hydrolase family protein [Rhizobium rhizogenes]NTF97919.1 fumarylacetoacetate hydrolase family protein [Rhizobium rhizogenes]
MKFATVTHRGTLTFGLVEDETIHLALPGETLRSRLAGDLVAVAADLRTRPSVLLSEVEFAPVIPDPAQIFCAGLNYQHHRDETRPEHRKAYPSHPVLFMRFATSLTGHGQPVVKPGNSEVVDYEGELAVIIGKGGRHIPKARALEHVAGVACFNDISMRDWQMRGEQWGPGKNFPTSGPFGPYLVTLDETGPLEELELRTVLNGQIMQQSKLDFLIFDIPTLIAYCSGFAELRPGDVIVTGTPGGVGFTRKPPVLLEPGKKVIVEIDRVGQLENLVVAE